MKTLPAFLLAACALSACGSPPADSADPAAAAPIASDTVTLFVAGLSCPN